MPGGFRRPRKLYPVIPSLPSGMGTPGYEGYATVRASRRLLIRSRSAKIEAAQLCGEHAEPSPDEGKARTHRAHTEPRYGKYLGLELVRCSRSPLGPPRRICAAKLARRDVARGALLCNECVAPHVSEERQTGAR